MATVAAYDESDYVAALRACAAERGAATVNGYREWASARGGVPSIARVVQHYGLWRSALAAAGLPQPRIGTRPGNARLYDESLCLAAVRLCAVELRRTPSYESYQAWTRAVRLSVGAAERERDRFLPPSGQTVRNKIGPRWAECLDRAGVAGPRYNR